MPEKINDYDDLLSRAKWDSISNEEKDEILRQLGDENYKNHWYKLLYALCRGGDKRHLPVILSYLDRTDVPNLTRLALQQLNLGWNVNAELTPYITRFIKGLDWDESEGVRLMAIMLAGTCLREIASQEMLQALWDVYENDRSDDPLDNCFYLDAYRSLANAVGIDDEDLPPDYWDEEQPENVVNAEILAKIKTRIDIGQG